MHAGRSEGPGVDACGSLGWECHIEPDRLLIWAHQEDALTLVRIGTHADLFG
ncbi:type II toxin-antitoxin system YafQ family toxin [Candidatus Poriferisocius sp.]|uniref:type II toxin-antitoxin system YafQ family toxin n=1 Tax=Candidatus Poriferisocius sp. TaxID=3101276 RepID=UPI003B5C8341